MHNTDAITVTGIAKSFKLPHEKQTSIKGALINFRKHKRGYENQKVLENVSFRVKKGEFFGIVGRNGSGKSTLLKLIAGIYTPDSGSISVSGTLTPFIELGVGFNPELSGRENVMLNGALLGFSRSEMESMYDDIVDFAELDRFMDQKLKNYSSGMQVRLAFSIAIRASSDILVLDEVLAVGDQAFQRKCYEYFNSLKDKKKTVVLVTHDMSAVRRFCDRAILVENGAIKNMGTPDKIATAYQKLFNSDVAKPEDIHEEDNRWGTGSMKEVSTKASISPNSILLTTEHVANEELINPVIGFTVFSSTGVNVLEANTLTTKIKLGKVAKGARIKLKWSFDNLLKDGSYRVSVGSCNDSLTEFYDWKNIAVAFTVIKPFETNGIVNPTIQAERVSNE